MKRIARIALFVLLLLASAVRPVCYQENADKYVHELNRKTTAAFKKGDLQQGAILAEQAYSYAVDHLGKKHPDTLVAGSNLVELHYIQGRYKEAKVACKENLRLRQDVLGANHQDTLESMGNMAILHQALGELKEAEKMSEEVLRLRKNVSGVNHESTLLAMNNLAGLYQARGRYSEAEKLFDEVLKVRTTILGREHLDTIGSINNLAVLYQKQGRYKEAEPLCKEALELYEKVLGSEHPNTLMSMNNLAFLYQTLGRYDKAKPLYKEALERYEKVLGRNHPDTLRAIGNLAVLHYSYGQYGEAEPLYKEALKRYEKVLGRNHPDTLRAINNLAFLYQAQGRYAEAEVLYNEARDISKNILGDKHPETIATIGNLAVLHQAQEQYDKAEPLYQEALKLLEEIFKKDHPDRLNVISNLAILYKEQGRYSDAEPLYQEAFKLREATLGREHPLTLISISNLAVLYKDQGRYNKAEPFYREALQLSEKVLGQEHPDTLITRINYIGFLVTIKQLQTALGLLKKQEQGLFSRSFQELYTSSSENVRRLYLQSISDFQDVALSLASQQPDKEYQQYAAEVMLRWKQVYAEESSVQHRLLNLSNDPETEKLRAELAAAQVKASQALYQQKGKPNLAELIEKASQDETALLALARHLRTGLEVKDVTLDKVQAVLPQDSGLIEYRLFVPVDFKTGKLGEFHLAVLLLLTDPKAKQRFFFLDLGRLAEIVKIVQEGGMKNAKVYKRLLGPFDEQIKNLKQLYIAPDGPLSLLSFASLRLPDGRFLVERQQINRLQTGRDLIENGKDFPRGKGLVAIGGIDYGEQPTGQTEDTLENSGPEVQTIKTIFTNNIAEETQVFLGENASEYNLKHLKQPPRILHLSTHGSYRSAEDDLSEKQRALIKYLANEAPLLLSCLHLAGAKNGQQGKLDKHGDDGLLYSLEVLGLNLHGTELVSLSACDTGKGVVDYSEGVYGLVRAFRTAGAKDVLMTLTPVGDKTSKDFMTTFYDKWLSSEKKISPAQALHQTRLQFIHDKKPVQDWSPYVLVGN